MYEIPVYCLPIEVDEETVWLDVLLDGGKSRTCTSNVFAVTLILEYTITTSLALGYVC